MFRSGFVSILGRPNVGKSTFFNAVLGDQISIVTSKPQTTRNRITGIKNYPDAQMIFLDTPGIHKPQTSLNRAIVQAAVETISDADILLMLVEAHSEVHPLDLLLIDSLKAAWAPVFLVINKIDLIQKALLLPLIDKFRQLYDYEEIFPISARTGKGLPELLENIKNVLPEGPQLFPQDILTDATERFIAAEFIREQITFLTKQEIPYASAVVVDSFKEDEEKNLIRISATINKPSPGAAAPRWFIGRNCHGSRCSTVPMASSPGIPTAPSRSCRVSGADAWSCRPTPTPGVSTPDRSKIAGEWIAPAASTTRSADITSPLASSTPIARRPSKTTRSTGESARTTRFSRSSTGHSEASAEVTRRPARRVSSARSASPKSASAGGSSPAVNARSQRAASASRSCWYTASPRTTR